MFYVVRGPNLAGAEALLSGPDMRPLDVIWEDDRRKIGPELLRLFLSIVETE